MGFDRQQITRTKNKGDADATESKAFVQIVNNDNDYQVENNFDEARAIERDEEENEEEEKDGESVQLLSSRHHPVTAYNGQLRGSAIVYVWEMAAPRWCSRFTEDDKYRSTPGHVSMQLLTKDGREIPLDEETDQYGYISLYNKKTKGRNPMNRGMFGSKFYLSRDYQEDLSVSHPKTGMARCCNNCLKIACCCFPRLYTSQATPATKAQRRFFISDVNIQEIQEKVKHFLTNGGQYNSFLIFSASDARVCSEKVICLIVNQGGLLSSLDDIQESNFDKKYKKILKEIISKNEKNHNRWFQNCCSPQLRNFIKKNLCVTGVVISIGGVIYGILRIVSYYLEKNYYETCKFYEVNKMFYDYCIVDGKDVGGMAMHCGWWFLAPDSIKKSEDFIEKYRNICTGIIGMYLDYGETIDTIIASLIILSLAVYLLKNLYDNSVISPESVIELLDYLHKHTNYPNCVKAIPKGIKDDELLELIQSQKLINTIKEIEDQQKKQVKKHKVGFFNRFKDKQHRQASREKEGCCEKIKRHCVML